MMRENNSLTERRDELLEDMDTESVSGEALYGVEDETDVLLVSGSTDNAMYAELRSLLAERADRGANDELDLEEGDYDVIIRVEFTDRNEVMYDSAQT